MNRTYGFAVLLAALGFTSEAAAEWKVWIEAEGYVAQNGSQAEFFHMPETASGERIVDNDWGRDPGDFLRWEVDLPEGCRPLFLTVKFARASSGPASISARIGDQSKEVRFPCTGGWGFQRSDWQFGRIRFDEAPAGQHVVELRATAPESNLNTDGLFLSNHPTKPPGKMVVLRDAAELAEREREQAAALLEDVERLPLIAMVVQHSLGNPDGVVRYHAWPGRVVRQWGCRIQVVDPSDPSLPPRVLFDDPDGAILDMNVSYDAKTLFFTVRRRGDDNWRLHEIGADGRALRQITDGPFSDFSPEELPCGDLVFCSTRVKSFNVCAQTLSSTLFAVGRDGSNLRQITMNTLNDMSPHVLPDGRILYTRWEYVDRDVKWRQSLWTVNPDGTKMQLYFGNTVQDPSVFWQARPIPGRHEVVATFAPHHGWPMGAIGTVTRRRGVETARGVGYRWITQEYPVIRDDGRLTEWAYRDPFPVGHHQFLVSYGGGLESVDRRFKIYLLDESDRKALVWADAELSCTYPLPLAKRHRPPRLVSRNPAKQPSTGTLLLQDVYAGLGDAVRRGEIERLRIMEQPAKFPVNESSPRVYEMTPVMGRRCYYRKRCLGTVPVESDGSAHFSVPAFRELYLQALDAEGRAIQSMGSAVTLAPGETQTCIGCHEHRNAAPPASRPPLAAGKPPATPTPYDWGNDGNIAFHVVVQPVLDEHCVRCHSGATPDGRLDLTGDRTRFFSMAYDGLWDRGLMHAIRLTANDGQVIGPKQAFSCASELPKYLDGQHHDARPSKQQRERVYVWIDSNSNYYGSHERTRPGTPGGRDLWADRWFAERFLPVYRQECGACHGPDLGRESYPQRSAWINLSRPLHSRVLTAHLAKDAGGWGMDEARNGEKPPIFQDAADPVYRALLAAVREGNRQMLANPRIDMPGAVPKPGQNDWGRFPGTAAIESERSPK